MHGKIRKRDVPGRVTRDARVAHPTRVEFPRGRQFSRSLLTPDQWVFWGSCLPRTSGKIISGASVRNEEINDQSLSLLNRRKNLALEKKVPFETARNSRKRTSTVSYCIMNCKSKRNIILFF